MDLKQYSRQYQKRAMMLRDVQVACRDLLLNHPAAESARVYLNTRVSKNNQEKFDFGFFPPDDHINLLLERIPEITLQKLGLVYKFHVQNDDCRVYVTRGMMNSHNIITPYKDMYGNNIAFVGRTTLPDEERKAFNLDKYRYTKGFVKSLHLFGLAQAKAEILKKGYVILVEGQIDCITCHEYGIHNVVALGGVAFTKYQSNLLRRLTDRFYLLLDGDAEGEKAQNKIIKRYSDTAHIEKITLPKEFKDVDTYLHAGMDVSILCT